MSKKEEEVGKKIQAGLQEDVSMAEATADLVDVPFYELAAGLLEASNVPVLDDLSTLDIFKPSLRQGPDTDIQVKGMGNFVRKVFGSGVPVHLNTPVTSIHWGGSNGVRLKTRAGTVEARAAIVTVPAGILSSGRLRFNPHLPAEHQTAIDQLRMGVLNKVAVGFSRDIFGRQVSTNTVVLPLRDTNLLPFLVTQLWDQNVALCFVGPVLGVELEKAGPVAMIAFALSQVAEMFGTSILKAFNGRATVTQWLSDRWTLGSYSYVEPGDAGARTRLAAPVDNRIFFAGEALSELSHSTVWGAYETGQAAAQKVLDVLAKVPRTRMVHLA
jgi:monoamine oxidase